MSLVDSYIESQDETILDKANKKELLKIAEHFGIVIRKDQRVDDIRLKLVEVL